MNSTLHFGSAPTAPLRPSSPDLSPLIFLRSSKSVPLTGEPQTLLLSLIPLCVIAGRVTYSVSYPTQSTNREKHLDFYPFYSHRVG